jgi:hypothetical protein
MWSLWLSAEASSGNVRAAHAVLEEMLETEGLEEGALLGAELDIIAAAIAFNTSAHAALQRFDKLLEDKK